MLKIKTVIIILFSLFLIQFVNAKEKSKPTIEKFAHENEKLKPHPKAEFETIKNGFRYVLLPNTTPEKRVFVYLYVNTGSLNETDNQQGLAHFLEHMAFNGSKDFPGDSLIDFFKKIGMNFGGDTNAHTSFNETVYQLNLPEEKYYEDAIKIMANYAMNITLDPKEIEKEKGIILSEKRSRDSIRTRIFEKSMQFSLPNVIISQRLPIGKEETIQTANQEELLDYYNTWYRPENMVLVVVGDIKPKPWHKAINNAFKNFKAKAPIRDSYKLQNPNHKGLKVNYIYEKESPDTSVEISTLAIQERKNLKYIDLRKIQIAEAAANYIINERLREISLQKDAPFITANFTASIWLKQVYTSGVEATCKPENWKSSLFIIENELRKALELGFTEQELSLFKKDYLNRLNVAVEKMTTINSSTYMQQILNSIANNTPFLDAKQNQTIDKPIIEGLTKEDILKEIKKYWATDHRLVEVTGNLEIKEPEIEIKQILHEASLIELHKNKEENIVNFPFEEKPKNDFSITKKETFKELNFTRYTFANNVVLNVKPTTFKVNEINFNIGFGLGNYSASENKPGIAKLASIAMNSGGLTKLSVTELNKTLTGRNASVNFSVGNNCFLFQSTTTPSDFELSLQLCRASLLYPGFREEASHRIKDYINQTYQKLETNIQAYFSNTIIRLVTNNNPTLTFPDRKTLESIQIDDIKSWLLPQFKEGAIEINVVGSMNEKEIVDLVGIYFGTLPKRSKIERLNRKELLTKEVFSKEEAFNTSINKALIFEMIPTTDYYNVLEMRSLNILSKILANRVTKIIREKLSISYSPFVYHSFDKDYKNACYLQFIADVDPLNIDKCKKAFSDIITDIISNDITQDEFDNAIKPTLTEIKTYINSNNFWLDRVLADSTAEPLNLTLAQTFLSDYENITLTQINTVAKKYLSLEKLSSFVLKATPPQKESNTETHKPIENK